MKPQAYRSRILAIILIFVAAPALAQRGGQAGNLRNSPDVRAAFRSVVAEANQSTVRVLCDGKDAAFGTIVGADGWIISKYSELHEPIVCRLQDGRRLSAQVVGQDSNYDLAMLKVDATGLKPVTWSTGSAPAVGQFLATTAPGELPRAVGVVSVPPRKIPPRVKLGVQFDSDDTMPAKIGLVSPGSPADKAGLKTGDVVIRVGEKAIETSAQLIDLIHRSRPLDTIALVVHRGSDDIKVSATLVSPSEAGDAASRNDKMNLMGGALSHRGSDFPTVIQHDTALLVADCGGPVVDLSGKVVGINIARGGRTESYAIPLEGLRPFLAGIESGKFVVAQPVAGAKPVAPTSAKPEDKKAGL